METADKLVSGELRVPPRIKLVRPPVSRAHHSREKHLAVDTENETAEPKTWRRARGPHRARVFQNERTRSVTAASSVNLNSNNFQATLWVLILS